MYNDKELLDRFKLTPEILEPLGLWHNGGIERDMIMERFLDDRYISEVPAERIKEIHIGKHTGMKIHRYPYWYYSSLWGREMVRQPKSFGSGRFKGNFIPQIPIMSIKRFTHQNDLVIDWFCGSGTTLDVCYFLNRRCLGLDLYPQRPDIIESLPIDLNEKAKLSILHPPYADLAIVYGDEQYQDKSIAKFSRGTGLSIPPTEFIPEIESILTQKVLPNTRDDGYVCLVIGDGWREKEIIPLSSMTISMFAKYLHIKHIITKYIGDWTSRLNRTMWEYRALRNNFGVLEHEYIVIFSKEG